MEDYLEDLKKIFSPSNIFTAVSLFMIMSFMMKPFLIAGTIALISIEFLMIVNNIYKKSIIVFYMNVSILLLLLMIIVPIHKNLVGFLGLILFSIVNIYNETIDKKIFDIFENEEDKEN